MELPNHIPSMTADGSSSVLIRLQRSELYREYQRAFVATTGLPLVLRKPGDFRAPMRESRRLNPFCRLMASTNKTCAACLRLQQRVQDSASIGPSTLECDAGLVESAVPVRIGTQVLGYLQTGQVFLGQRSRKTIDGLFRDLPGLDEGLKRAEVEFAYMQTRVMGKSQYASILRLLAIFADHLAAVSNQLMIRDSVLESPAITKVRSFIAEHQSEELSLRDVARAVNMSAFYFCKAFKRSTGLTFTGYLARSRIESVKARLVNVYVHVSEAAYASGFQSLSQFNRVFRRIVGESPSDYRQRIQDHGAITGRSPVRAA